MFNTGSLDIILLQYKQAYAVHDLHQKLDKIAMILFCFFCLVNNHYKSKNTSEHFIKLHFFRKIDQNESLIFRGSIWKKFLQISLQH